MSSAPPNGSLEEGRLAAAQAKRYSTSTCIFAAVFYGFTSISITFFNKATLSVWDFNFSNIMTMGQMVFSIFVLWFLKAFGMISYPSFSWSTSKALIPLTFSFVSMVVTGLAALRLVNIAMFSVLRRGTTLLVMVAEYYMMGKVAPWNVRLSVVLMIAGAVVAAIWDLTFDLVGYVLTLINCAVTALYLVHVSKIGKTTGLNTFALLYYTNVLSLPFMIIVCIATGEAGAVISYPHLHNPWFQFCFLMSAVQAVLLNYSIFYCTNINSALTTSVVGHLKNILTTVLGLFAFGDVPLNTLNVIGLAISTYGGTWYAYLKYLESQTQRSSRTA
mmetsp:Transcript_12495/g.20372  ORF Transcript_12495/g.20372 Transcript_12495/m.20372 type:complete len:331 (-) Transcript_12495:465-1457(-)